MQNDHFHFCLHLLGIHYVGEMAECETSRILIDQITEGQVSWVPMDREYDLVSHSL